MFQFTKTIELLDNMSAVCREHQLSVTPGVIVLGDYLSNLDGLISFCRNNLYTHLRDTTIEQVTDLLWNNLRRPLASAPPLDEDHQNWAVERLQQLLDAFQAAIAT